MNVSYEGAKLASWQPAPTRKDPKLVAWETEFFLPDEDACRRALRMWEGYRLENLKKHGLDPFGVPGLEFWRKPEEDDPINHPNALKATEKEFGTAHRIAYSEEMVERMIAAAERDVEESKEQNQSASVGRFEGKLK